MIDLGLGIDELERARDEIKDEIAELESELNDLNDAISEIACDAHTFDYTALADDEFIDFLVEMGMDRKDISYTTPGKGGIIVDGIFIQDIDL